ncbi:hypothetical protein ACFRCQ_26600 [Cytobacillus firmus]|uniref:hypothetical protein n=1 Tax=Cytobacillus firmus TaxID=1399 RepID=UPI0036A68DC4
MVNETINCSDLNTQIKEIYKKLEEKIISIDNGILEESLNKADLTKFQVKFHKEVHVYPKEENYNTNDEIRNSLNVTINQRIDELREIYLQLSITFNTLSKLLNHEIELEEHRDTFNDLYELILNKRRTLVNLIQKTNQL